MPSSLPLCALRPGPHSQYAEVSRLPQPGNGHVADRSGSAASVTEIARQGIEGARIKRLSIINLLSTNSHRCDYGTCECTMDIQGEDAKIRMHSTPGSTKSYNFTLGWVPRTDDRNLPTYTRDPITHAVSKFQLNSSRQMSRTETQFNNVGGLNYEGRRFNRLKGVVDYGDQTHLFHPRFSKAHAATVETNPRVFRMRSNPITQYAEDAIRTRHQPGPFTVGR